MVIIGNNLGLLGYCVAAMLSAINKAQRVNSAFQVKCKGSMNTKTVEKNKQRQRRVFLGYVSFSLKKRKNTLKN